MKADTNAVFGGMKGYLLIYVDNNNNVLYSESTVTDDIDKHIENATGAHLSDDVRHHIFSNGFKKKIIFEITKLEYYNTAEFEMCDQPDGAVDSAGRTLN